MVRRLPTLGSEGRRLPALGSEGLGVGAVRPEHVRANTALPSALHRITECLGLEATSVGHLVQKKIPARRFSDDVVGLRFMCTCALEALKVGAAALGRLRP